MAKKGNSKAKAAKKTKEVKKEWSLLVCAPMIAMLTDQVHGPFDLSILLPCSLSFFEGTHYLLKHVELKRMKEGLWHFDHFCVNKHGGKMQEI